MFFFFFTVSLYLIYTYLLYLPVNAIRIAWVSHVQLWFADLRNLRTYVKSYILYLETLILYKNYRDDMQKHRNINYLLTDILSLADILSL